MEKESKNESAHKEKNEKRDCILSSFFALRHSLERPPCFSVSVPFCSPPSSHLPLFHLLLHTHTRIPAGPLDRRTAPFSMSSASPGGIGSANMVRRLRWLGVCAKHQMELVCVDGMGGGSSSVVDKGGATPMDLAVEQDCTEAVQAFLSRTG